MKKFSILSLLFLISCSSSTNEISETTLLIPEVLQAQSKTVTDTDLRKEYMKPSHLWPKANVSPELEYREIGVLPQMRYAQNNPFTKNKSDLGRLLFSEMKLSGSGNMSCLSCHNPQKSWADGLQTPFGSNAQPLKRNSPSIVNTAYHNLIFWDGRVKTLEEQAKAVLLNPDEMNSTEEIIQKNLQDSHIYKNLFKQTFGDEQITLDRVSKALAIFEREIVTKNKSPFDQFVLGKSESLSDSQVRGLHLFRTKARCMNCHNGPNFTDDKRHNIGLVMEGTKFEDTGFYNITKKDSDYGLFRTPTLRNITKTAPYFHNGLVLNLNGVMNLYSNGMPASKNKSKHIVPIGLETSDREDLKSFLEALSEDVPNP